MTIEPLISQQVKSANKFLWAVKTYMDLISRDDKLVHGSGLRRLYAMASGAATLNDGDVEAITAKADRLGLTPAGLDGFMMKSVLKNIEIYGKELQRIIQARIVSIANGDIRNPDPLFKFSAEEARRYFYIPPSYFVTRVLKALNEDFRDRNQIGRPTVVTLQDVANDADILLARMQMDEGHVAPNETSWGSLSKIVDGIIEVLEREAQYPEDYRIRARGGLKILWFIAKLLLGDLTIKPLRKDINLVDLDQRLSLSDGTLAAIPFPLRETVSVFSDNDGRGITLKGRFYLQAVSGASFYRADADGSTDRD